MAYDLIINRVGALAGRAAGDGGSEPRFSGDELAKVFEKHIRALETSDPFRHANFAIETLARKAGGWAEYLKPSANFPDASLAIEINGPTRDWPETLVGLLPWKRLECKISDTQWILRTRASVTACALQHRGLQTKLWWTFEGIPKLDDPDKRPDESEINEFVRVADGMVAIAMPLLRDGYLEALADGPQGRAKNFDIDDPKIRISLTDNNTRNVAALFDALDFEGREVSQIAGAEGGRLKEAKRGLEEFEKFVEDVTGATDPVRDDTVKVDVDANVVGVKGVVCRHHDTKRHRRNVVGFARRQGARTGFGLLSVDQKRQYLSEENIRATSAARALSGTLANSEARRFDAALIPA